MVIPRQQLIELLLGTIFLFIGLATCAIAAIRHRTGIRLLVWFGLFVGLFGIRMLAHIPVAVALLPHSLQIGAPYAIAFLKYLLIIPALLFWLELSTGKLRAFVQIAILAGLLIGVAGFSWFLMAGMPDTLMPYASLLAICTLLVLTTVVSIPALSRKLLVVQSKVLAIGMLVVATAAIYVNVSALLHLRYSSFIEPPAFAIFVFSLGYVAVKRIFTAERRLLSIENELRVARQIQSSILPIATPEIESLQIAANYHPMTAVAGDFYHFIPVDPYRAGILVADVSGHGVPAALIASMIKVAVHSVIPCAHDPAQVLQVLNRILSAQLHGQFVSAAYLWINMESRQARYSAAGHPPLLCWHSDASQLNRIESNGLLFGVMPEAEYPVCDVPLRSGDHILLYTDGVVEPENAGGESFGDRRLEQVLRTYQQCRAPDLSTHILSEIRKWQPASVTQQDDITLLIVDVL